MRGRAARLITWRGGGADDGIETGLRTELTRAFPAPRPEPSRRHRSGSPGTRATVGPLVAR